MIRIIAAQREGDRDDLDHRWRKKKKASGMICIILGAKKKATGMIRIILGARRKAAGMI